MLAGQDFRHTVQEEAEKVTDYIHRMESLPSGLWERQDKSKDKNSREAPVCQEHSQIENSVLHQRWSNVDCQS